MGAMRWLPTGNREWGFYGTVSGAGMDADLMWKAASCALLEGIEGLSARGARALLDSRLGRHLADGLAGRGGERQPGVATARRYILDSLAGRSTWSEVVATLVACDVPDQVRRRVVEDPPADEAGAVVLALARQFLGFETLRMRGSDSLDFREVAAESVEAALRAAYEAGRKAGA
jgi:hypothetical protein